MISNGMGILRGYVQDSAHGGYCRGRIARVAWAYRQADLAIKRICIMEEDRMKVIVTERIAEEGIQYERQGFEVDTRFGLSHDDLMAIIAEYDAIIVRSVTKVRSELIESC